MRIPENEWDRAVEVLEAAADAGRPLVLACHVDPDGDALGSMLALHLYLQRRGVESYATWGSQPFQVPPQYTFLPGLDRLTPPERLPEEPAALITFDLPGPARLGALAPLVERVDCVVVLDHHTDDSARGVSRRPAPPDFGDVRLVDDGASATAAITEELLRRLGAELDPELATCLYVGLVTDTGRFQYPNTEPETMELAARLLAAGVDPAEVGRRVYETHTFGYLKLLAVVLERASLDVGCGLLHTWLTDEDLADRGVALEETESLIDVVRTVRAADVVMVAKELGGSWKVSLRATDGQDVGDVAQRLGGGGHRFAAGLTWEGTYDGLVAAIKDTLAEIAALPEAG